MKRVSIALALGAALLAAAAPRVEASSPSVCLYADAAHVVMSYSGSPFTFFTLYVWWYPGDEGFMGAEYNLEFPSNVIKSGVTQNAGCGLSLWCEWGLCCFLGSCQTDWAYTHYMTCMLMDSSPSYIQIVPYPGDPVLVAMNCSSGEDGATILNRFGINQGGFIGVESASWGAIRGLYR